VIEENLGIPAFAGITGVTMTSTLRHSGQAQREPESNALRRQGPAFAATKAWIPTRLYQFSSRRDYVPGDVPSRE